MGSHKILLGRAPMLEGLNAMTTGGRRGEYRGQYDARSGEQGCVLRFGTVDHARRLFIPRFVWLRASNARRSQRQVDKAGLPNSYPSI